MSQHEDVAVLDVLDSLFDQGGSEGGNSAEFPARSTKYADLFIRASLIRSSVIISNG